MSIVLSVRVLSPENPGGVPLPATLEDGYMLLMGRDNHAQAG